MIRALHLADIHPNNGATFAGKLAIDPETGQNLALTDLHRSLRYVHHVTTQDPATECDLALIAGDVFDAPKPHPNEIRIIRDFLIGLAEYVPVVAIPGNHDLSQNPMDATALEAIKGLDNVHVAERPESRLLSIRGQQVQIFCLPYPTKSRLLIHEAAKNKSPEEITAIINQGLAAILRGFVADQIAGIPHILLAHGSVGHAIVGDQPRSLEHDILIPREDLDHFEYVALGHIHYPQQISLTAWYSGSLMRATFGEEHDPKGFNLVEIEAGTPGRVRRIENPHARQYVTFQAVDLPEIEEMGGKLNPEVVWRFKDSLTDDQYQAIKPVLDRLGSDLPWFQIDIDRAEETRARDAGMSQVLTTDAALTRALAGKVEESEIPAILEKHRALEQEVG